MPGFPIHYEPNPAGTDPNDPAGTAGDVTDFSRQVKSDFKSAFGLMPDLPGIKGPLKKLRNQYGKVDETFDFSKTMAEGQTARGYNKDVAVGAANTASQAYISGGGSADAAGAAVIRARALQPALKADADTALQLASMRDDAAKGALDMKVKIATTLGELKSNYINTLASYNTSRAGNATTLMKFNEARRLMDQQNQPLPPIPPGPYFQGQ